MTISIIIAQLMQGCFPAHDEGSQDRWGMELAPGEKVMNLNTAVHLTELFFAQDYGYWYGNGCLLPEMASIFMAVDK